MKKNILKALFCLFAIAAVVPDYAAVAQSTKGLTRSIIINNGDTTVNGKKFSELDKNERAKLLEEFKEMEKNFRRGSARAEENNVVIKRNESGTGEVVISRNGKEPNILFWNDDISDHVTSFNFNEKTPGDLQVFKYNGDSA